MKGKTVVLDAGHGGSDTGAAWRGRLEKDDTLLLARQTGRQLERLGYFVSYTRPEDQFLPLDRRLEHARAAGGSACPLHAGREAHASLSLAFAKCSHCTPATNLAVRPCGPPPR